MHKMQNPIDKMFFLGFIAGIWVGLGGIAGKFGRPLTSQTNYLTRLLYARNHGGRWDSYRSSPTMADPPKVGNRRGFPFRLTLHSPIWWGTLHGELHDPNHRSLESNHTAFQSPHQSPNRMDRQLPRLFDMRRSVLLRNRTLLSGTLPIFRERPCVYQSQRTQLGQYLPTRHSCQHTRLYGSHARFRCKRQRW